MREDLQKRLLSVSASLAKLGGPKVERNPRDERKHAIEEAALEGAVTVMEKLEELLGVPANTNAKHELAEKITAILMNI